MPALLEAVFQETVHSVHLVPSRVAPPTTTTLTI